MLKREESEHHVPKEQSALSPRDTILHLGVFLAQIGLLFVFGVLVSFCSLPSRPGREGN